MSVRKSMKVYVMGHLHRKCRGLREREENQFFDGSVPRTMGQAV